MRGDTAGIANGVVVMCTVVAIKAVSEIMRAIQGTKDRDRRIAKVVGCAIVTTTGAIVGVTAGEWHGAVPLPNIGASQGRGRGQNYSSADGQTNRRSRRASDVNTVLTPPRKVSSTRQNVTSAEQPPEPHPEIQEPQTPRQRMSKGGVERPD